jgi:hypothetical protein
MIMLYIAVTVITMAGAYILSHIPVAPTLLGGAREKNKPGINRAQ